MNTDDPKDPSETRAPWWASDGPNEDLPDGYPEPPDLSKVKALRSKLKQDRANRRKSRDTLPGRLPIKSGKQVREIGAMTLIPTLMIAGPAVGYGLGMLVNRQFGGSPWPEVGGLLFGLVAAFRQIFLILNKKNAPNPPENPE